MYKVLGGSGSDSSPGTQGSSTPAAYQTPYFDVDAYYRPSAPRYGQTQGLSQIRKIFPDEHTSENLLIGARRGGDGGGRGGGSSGGHEFDAVEDKEDEEDLGRHPYSRKETMTLFCWGLVPLAQRKSCINK